MTAVLVAGVAVIDFVFLLDAMPRRAEKFRARDAAISGGGCAANAAAAVARLGGHARLAARIGTDAIGDMIVSGLEAEGVDCSLVKRFEGRRSSFSSVLVDGQGERQIVNFRDEEMSFDAKWLEAAMPATFDAALADTRWPMGAAAAMRAARQRSVPGVLDAEMPVREAADAMAVASHVAFSVQGLRDFAGRSGIEAGLRSARRELAAWLCCTDGKNGVSYLTDGVLRRIPAFPVEAVDTLGAGDVWHGAFALALGEARGEAEAILFANAAAALKCTRFGGRAGIPGRSETDAFMRQRQ